jgi:hypothetical protein
MHGDNVALTKIAEREFIDNKRVHCYARTFGEPCQPCVAQAQMVDPDGRVDQDHLTR